jgi:hypothetical protein
MRMKISDQSGMVCSSYILQLRPCCHWYVKIAYLDWYYQMWLVNNIFKYLDLLYSYTTIYKYRLSWYEYQVFLRRKVWVVNCKLWWGFAMFICRMGLAGGGGTGSLLGLFHSMYRMCGIICSICWHALLQLWPRFSRTFTHETFMGG